VPRLWTETIEAHRRQVHDAILDAAWALVTQHGVLSVTMSHVAERAGIGRATLYKYFPDVEAILRAWHRRHVTDHLDQLAELRDRPGDPGQRLEAVLEAYALIAHHRQHHGSELAALLHGGEDVDQAQRHVLALIKDMLDEVKATGGLRDDVPSDELATYCVHALNAAASLSSEAAVRRLVEVTLAGIRRQ
jgi:AcrR family transcriptional regulator